MLLVLLRIAMKTSALRLDWPKKMSYALETVFVFSAVTEWGVFGMRFEKLMKDVSNSTSHFFPELSLETSHKSLFIQQFNIQNLHNPYHILWFKGEPVIHQQSIAWTFWDKVFPSYRMLFKGRRTGISKWQENIRIFWEIRVGKKNKTWCHFF